MKEHLTYDIEDEIKIATLYGAKGTEMQISDGEGHLTGVATARLTVTEAMHRIGTLRGAEAAKGLDLRATGTPYREIEREINRSARSVARDWEAVLAIVFPRRVPHRT